MDNGNTVPTTGSRTFRNMSTKRFMSMIIAASLACAYLLAAGADESARADRTWNEISATMGAIRIADAKREAMAIERAHSFYDQTVAHALEVIEQSNGKVDNTDLAVSVMLSSKPTEPVALIDMVDELDQKVQGVKDSVRGWEAEQAAAEAEKKAKDAAAVKKAKREAAAEAARRGSSGGSSAPSGGGGGNSARAALNAVGGGSVGITWNNAPCGLSRAVACVNTSRGAIIQVSNAYANATYGEMLSYMAHEYAHVVTAVYTPYGSKTGSYAYGVFGGDYEHIADCMSVARIGYAPVKGYGYRCTAEQRRVAGQLWGGNWNG